MLFRCVVLSEGVNMNKEYDVALIYAIQQILAGGYIEKRSILLNGIHRQGIFLYDLLELFPRPLSERRITSSMGLRLTKEESISHIEISVALACFICNEPIGRYLGRENNFIPRSGNSISKDMYLDYPLNSLKWMLGNIELGYLSISSARSELEHPMPHCNSIKLQIGLGGRYKNIMGESWQRSC